VSNNCEELLDSVWQLLYDVTWR